MHRLLQQVKCEVCEKNTHLVAAAAQEGSPTPSTLKELTHLFWQITCHISWSHGLSAS